MCKPVALFTIDKRKIYIRQMYVFLSVQLLKTVQYK